MQTRKEKFSKKGKNPFNPSGDSSGICPKCKAHVPSKPGFRLASLSCPKCGASMRKR